MSATDGAGTAYPSGAPGFTPIFSGVHATRSLVLCVCCFVDHCLSHCVFCPSLIYGFWLPLWYLKTLLINMVIVDLNHNTMLLRDDFCIGLVIGYYPEMMSVANTAGWGPIRRPI